MKGFSVFKFNHWLMFRMQSSHPRHLLAVLIMACWMLSAQAVRAETFDVCPSGCPYTLVQAAILAASDGDTVRLFYDGTLVEPNILVDRDITFEGFAGFDTQLRGAVESNNATNRIFWIAEGVSVTMRNFNLRAGKDNPGGCIKNEGTLILESMYLAFCNAIGGDGGAIYNGPTATMTMDGVSITETYAEGSGGAIYNSGKLQIRSSLFSYGIADLSYGGLIYNDGELLVDGSSFSSGSASQGGAIYVATNSLLDVNDSKFQNNRALRNINSVVQGGAIMVYGDADILNSSFRNNYARNDNDSSRGGAISVDSLGDAAISNSTFILNGEEQQDYGGAIYVDMGAQLELASVTVTENTAQAGGGIYVFSGVSCAPFCKSGEAQVANSIIYGNDAVNRSATDDCSGQLYSYGYNLVGVGGGPRAVNVECVLPGVADGLQFGVNPLFDTSFPSVSTTDVVPIQAGSPAIDAGNPAGCLDTVDQLLTVDQRGAPRLGICDLGAFEFGSLPPMFSDGFESP